jgi:hypothetical protein
MSRFLILIILINKFIAIRPYIAKYIFFDYVHHLNVQNNDVQSLAFKLTVLRSKFLCLSIEFLLATVILYAKNCTHRYFAHLNIHIIKNIFMTFGVAIFHFIMIFTMKAVTYLKLAI